MSLTYRIRRLFDRRAVVLMYHRIAGVAVDPWQMAVSPEHFEEQLQVLEKKYRVIPVQELIRQLHKGSLSPGSICLTFDDGYADNYRTAMPLLEKYQCPASFFMVTRFIGREHLFWWNVLGDVLLNAEKLPETLSLRIREKHVSFRLNGDAKLTGELRQKHRAWHWPDPPPSGRAAVYLDIYERLKPLPYEERQVIMEEIRSWPEGHRESPAQEACFPVTAAELLNIGKHPLLDIGLHTHSHPALGFHPPEIQYQEIENCRKYLENTIDRYMNTLAYPHGSYNRDTLRVVREQQLGAAFTTEEQAITKRAGLYRLGRFQVGSWNGEEFERRLSAWVEGRV